MHSHIYLQPMDDDLPMRPSGSWVIEKLDYLERYIDVFETAMRKKWLQRCYVDLFSGPGKCLCRDTGVVYLGSPLLALTTRYPFSDYFFVDLDSDNIGVLQQRCSVSPLANRIHFIEDDANVAADRVVELLEKKASLNLAFLDPEGLELHWSTVAALARLAKMDLIIHYPQMALTRVMPNVFQSDNETGIDRFFGDRGWRRIYEQYCRQEEHFLHRQLMDYYKSKLQGLGYKDAFRDDEVGAEPLMRNEKNAPLYRLLFASKHPLGLKFWQAVTDRNVHGQRRLL